MVYDRLKSLVGLWGEEYCCWVIIVEGSFRVMWTGDDWLWMGDQCPRLGGLRWVHPGEGQG